MYVYTHACDHQRPAPLVVPTAAPAAPDGSALPSAAAAVAAGGAAAAGGGGAAVAAAASCSMACTTPSLRKSGLNVSGSLAMSSSAMCTAWARVRLSREDSREARKLEMAMSCARVCA